MERKKQQAQQKNEEAKQLYEQYKNEVEKQDERQPIS